MGARLRCAGLAAAAVALTVPTLVAPAMPAWASASTVHAADDAATDLASALQLARSNFRRSVEQARAALRTTNESIQDQITLETWATRDRYLAARTQYAAAVQAGGSLARPREVLVAAADAYRAALVAARSTHEAELATAVGSARALVLTARTQFLSDVTAAYARFAPGEPVPHSALDPGLDATINRSAAA